MCDVASMSRVSDSLGAASLHSPFFRLLQSVRKSAELHARRVGAGFLSPLPAPLKYRQICRLGVTPRRRGAIECNSALFCTEESEQTGPCLDGAE